MSSEGHQTFFSAKEEVYDIREAYKCTVVTFGPGVCYDCPVRKMGEQLGFFKTGLTADKYVACGVVGEPRRGAVRSECAHSVIAEVQAGPVCTYCTFARAGEPPALASNACIRFLTLRRLSRALCLIVLCPQHHQVPIVRPYYSARS